MYGIQMKTGKTMMKAVLPEASALNVLGEWVYGGYMLGFPVGCLGVVMLRHVVTRPNIQPPTARAMMYTKDLLAFPFKRFAQDV
jgi:hypothetical protein